MIQCASGCHVHGHIDSLAVAKIEHVCLEDLKAAEYFTVINRVNESQFKKRHHTYIPYDSFLESFHYIFL